MKWLSPVWLAGLALLSLACAAAATLDPTVPPLATSPASTPQQPTPRPTPTLPAAARAKHGGTLKIAVYDDIVAWDFMASNNPYASTRMPQSLAFNQLLSVANTPGSGCTLYASPELVERFNWRDDRVLELTLRQDVRFHSRAPVNGRAMTPQDVVFSLQRFGQKQARVQSAFANISSIEATGPYTVRLTLKAPDSFITQSSFLSSSYGAYVLAPEAGGPEGKWDNPASSYIGTGPFLFGSYVPGVKTSWRRNPDYWKPMLPYVDGVDFLIVPEVSSWAALLRSGKIDLVPYAVPLPMAEELEVSAPQLAQSSCPGQSVTSLAMRTDKPPFSDVRVRRALSMAIDRDGLNKSVWAARGSTPLVSQPSADPLVAPWAEVPQEVRKYYEYRPEEASRLLAEAGYPGGKGLNFTVHAHLTLTLGLKHEVEGIVAAWERLGLAPDVEWLEGGPYYNTVGAGKYEGVAVRGMFVPLYRLAENYVSTSAPGQNASYVRDPELDALFTALRSVADPDRQAALGRKIQDRIMQQVYYVQMVVGDNVTIWQPWVRDFGPVAEYLLARPWAEVLWLER